MAGVNRFEIEIHGVGTHAAVPDAGVDPIVASSQIVMALQTIVSRNISSSHNAVVSVTNIHSGNTWNVIPEKLRWKELYVHSKRKHVKRFLHS